MDALFAELSSAPFGIMTVLRENVLDAYDKAFTDEMAAGKPDIFEDLVAVLEIAPAVGARLRAAERDSARFAGVARRKLQHKIMSALSAHAVVSAGGSGAPVVTRLQLETIGTYEAPLLRAVYDVMVYGHGHGA